MKRNDAALSYILFATLMVCILTASHAKGAPLLHHNAEARQSSGAMSRRANLSTARVRFESQINRALNSAELANLRSFLESQGAQSDLNPLHEIGYADDGQFSTYFCVGVDATVGAAIITLVPVTMVFCLNPRTFKSALIMPGNKNAVAGMFIALQGAVAVFKGPAAEDVRGRYAGFKFGAGDGLALTSLYGSTSDGRKEVELAGIGFGGGAGIGLVSIDVE